MIPFSFDLRLRQKHWRKQQAKLAVVTTILLLIPFGCTAPAVGAV